MRSRMLPATVALVIDVLLVTSFAALGRASHDEHVFVGLWTTAWPFLTGLALGWLVTRGWNAPFAAVRTGIPVWIAAVLLGMLLRAVTGQGTALAFVIVATLTLLLLLVGWRMIAGLVMRLMRRRPNTAESVQT